MHNEQRMIDATQRPPDLKTAATIAAVTVVAFLVVAFGMVALVAWLFGMEGARMLMVVAAMLAIYWLVNRTHSQVRRENLHDLTQVQSVAVQSIIQHQRADDQGEIARDLVPAAFKALVEQQGRGQQLATEIVRHGRFLADSEAKAARNQKSAFPFEMADTEEEMEEII